jgi:hypothetical protein
MTDENNEVKGSSVDPFSNLQALTKPRDLAWDNWAKFPEIGAEVSGYIRDVFYRPAETATTGQVMKDQRALTLEQQDGTLINVGIKTYPFVLAQTDNLRLGDPLKIVFSKTIPAKEKMMSPTKVFSYFGKNMPENAGNPTVKELTDADQQGGGTVKAAPSSVEDDIQLDTKDETPPMEGMPATA